MKTALELYIMQQVKSCRLTKNIRTEDLAHILGVTVNFINNIETPSSRDKYNLTHLIKIAYLFECDVAQFLPNNSKLEQLYPDLYEIKQSIKQLPPIRSKKKSAPSP